MKKFELSSDVHVILGVEAASVLNVFVDVYNKSQSKEIKIPKEALSILSGLEEKRAKKYLKKLITQGIIIKAPKKNGYKSNFYELNKKELDKLNKQASTKKFDWCRGYGDNKFIKQMTIDEIYKQLWNENKRLNDK